MSTRRPLEIVRPFTVQTYDIDYARHVNNQVYIRWLEDLRMAFLDAYCPLRELESLGSVPVLFSTHIEYRRPVVIYEALHGHMWLEELGRTAYTLGAEFVVEGAARCIARQRGMLIKLETSRPARWPKHLVDDYHRDHTQETPGA